MQLHKLMDKYYFGEMDMSDMNGFNEDIFSDQAYIEPIPAARSSSDYHFRNSGRHHREDTGKYFFIILSVLLTLAVISFIICKYFDNKRQNYDLTQRVARIEARQTIQGARREQRKNEANLRGRKLSVIEEEGSDYQTT